jgi:hypothetical protein
MVAELFSPGACFAKGTQVELKDGTCRPIEAVRLGDILLDGGRVTALHIFHSYEVIYDVSGVRVTGDHLVYHRGEALYVRDHPAAVSQNRTLSELCCLTTTTRRIPCKGSQDTILFGDWEEIPDTDTGGLRAWFGGVWRILNGGVAGDPPAHVLDSEAGLSPDCLVQCVDWLGRRVMKPIRSIGIGDRVSDGPKTTTTVVGKVTIAGDQTTDAVEIGGGLVSCATWVQHADGLWKPVEGAGREVHPVFWEHLYTQSGKFMIGGGHLVRDASDVGLDRLRPLVDSIVLAIESEHT